MKSPVLRGGTLGWLLLAGFVTTWDMFAEETLSMAFWRAVRTPRKRWVVIVVWAYITVHLFHLIPERFDPLRRLDNLTKGGKWGNVHTSPVSSVG
jgi:hypothetical protein